ncbi:MAG TPA: solute carrier family 23 protein, partial [Gaiellales bacterium]|nr:solute carrier family 23 protein [Gaiellales bacterium]
TSASFVAAVAAIRAQGGDSADVTGAILIAGLILAAVGVIVHFGGSHYVRAVLPPAVTGAVVMLIGFNLAPVVASIYWPQDQWVALLTMAFVIVCSLVLRGFWGRISILLGLVFGYVLSWILDKTAGQITSVLPGQNLRDASGNPCDKEGTYCVATAFAHSRTGFGGVQDAPWFGVPNFTAPHFSFNFALLVLPAVIALIAENAGHVKAVSEMTKRDLDPMLGRAIFADGVGTVVASAVGGSPTTTYAENIGVMAATRVYSTAAYYVAAIVALLLGLCPKFGALVNIIPGGVLGGITVVLYGMIGLLGAKIWKENRVDFANPINLVPLAAGIIIAIGNVQLQITENFSLAGIAFGGSPTTTYAENIGVMGATKVYSTAAYYVAAIVAVLLGLCPKFGALVNIIPGGVLGGITVVLYGMIGLLGAKIWKENRVDFANPINLVPLAAGIIIGIGNITLVFSDTFSLTGIALGTIVAVAGWHLARVLSPAPMRQALEAERSGVDDGAWDELGGADP